MTHRRHAAEEPLRLELQGATVLELITGSGKIEVVADGEPGVVTVEGMRPPRRGSYRRSMRREGKRWIVHPRPGSRSLRAHCPPGMNVTVSTRSGEISLQGPLGEVRAAAGSGRIEAAGVESLEARTRSGRIAVRDCEGRARLGVASGRVLVERAGAVALLAVSGKVQLREIAGKVEACTVSGSVQVQTEGEDDISVITISGNVKIQLPPEVHPRVEAKQMSGKLRNDLPEGEDVRLRLRTVSGNIAIGSV